MTFAEPSHDAQLAGGWLLLLRETMPDDRSSLQLLQPFFNWLSSLSVKIEPRPSAFPLAAFRTEADEARLLVGVNCNWRSPSANDTPTGCKPSWSYFCRRPPSGLGKNIRMPIYALTTQLARAPRLRKSPACRAVWFQVRRADQALDRMAKSTRHVQTVESSSFAERGA